MIQLEHVSKRFGKAVVLQDVNLTFEEGIIYGLRGNNGSGKTMLMRTIAGLMKPTEGTVKLDGSFLYKDMDFPESIGTLIENPSFIGHLHGLENLKIIASYMSDTPLEIARAAMEAVGLDPDDKRKYYKYSLGMKQRLGVAAAIMGEPDIILLDEPINAIDEQGVEIVKNELLRLREGRVILIACHDKEELDYLADKIIYVKEGRFYEKMENIAPVSSI